MSVTFKVSPPHTSEGTRRLRVSCYCKGSSGKLYKYEGDHTRIRNNWRNVWESLDGCTSPICGDYPPKIRVLDGTESLPMVTVSNANADIILKVLGLKGFEESTRRYTTDTTTFMEKLMQFERAAIQASPPNSTLERIHNFKEAQEYYLRSVVRQLFNVEKAASDIGAAVSWSRDNT